ncbi:unnamed protein product [Mytilus coruscus]|uniref:Proline-rich transmembrane protein 3/4 domain-containing protein n=1 Tax=Mytilus coruscus TaxID=42192 RepID=A0A6J8DPM3_MYTCO|nr:unnamed protein product [Mytilus coruscus]
MLSNNTTFYMDQTQSVYGIPNETDMKYCCYEAFLTHNYLFAFVYLIAYVYGMSLIIKYVKLLIRQRLMFAILVLAIISEVCTITFLLIDPYGLLKRMPEIILSFLWKIPDTIMLWNFFLLHYFLSEQTRLHIGTPEIKNFNLLLVCCIVESVLLAICIILTCFQVTTFPLPVINDGIVTILAFLLLSVFIYGAPQLSQYIRETKRASKSFNEFSSYKKNQSFDCYQKRLQFPKIRKSESSFRKISLTSFSDSSVVEGKVQVEKHQAIFSKAIKRPCDLNIKPNSFTDDILNFGKKSQSKEMTNEDFILDITKDKLINPNTATDSVYKEVPQEECYSAKFLVLDNELIPNDFNDVRPENSKSTSNEQGYLADGECHSHMSENSLDSRSKSFDSQQTTMEANRKNPAGFPVSISFLSLYRVRQFKMLQRMLKVCYIQTFSLGILIICKLYIIFSEYGGIFYTRRLKPVTWLVFQSLYRTVEFTISLVYTAAVHVYTSSKPSGQTRKRK